MRFTIMADTQSPMSWQVSALASEMNVTIFQTDPFESLNDFIEGRSFLNIYSLHENQCYQKHGTSILVASEQMKN